MWARKYLLILILSLTFVFIGCTQNNNSPKIFVCPDGSEVANKSICPTSTPQPIPSEISPIATIEEQGPESSVSVVTENTSNELSSPSPEPSIQLALPTPEPTIIPSPSPQKNCDDGNACTYDILDTHGECVYQTKTPCCGNNICEDGEGSCRLDCPHGTGPPSLFSVYDDKGYYTGYPHSGVWNDSVLLSIGDTVQMTITAQDPDNDAMKYALYIEGSENLEVPEYFSGWQQGNVLQFTFNNNPKQYGKQGNKCQYLLKALITDLPNPKTPALGVNMAQWTTETGNGGYGVGYTVVC